MPYIPTIEQLVDVFTEGLHKGQFNSITWKLGMKVFLSQFEGEYGKIRDSLLYGKIGDPLLKI